MEKKLPKVFANKIEKELHNNEKVYVSNKNEEQVIENSSIGNLNIKEMDVSKKIRSIFNSKNYIYKADVEITRENGKVVKKIIGKNGNHLITIDNEIIPIDTIQDIRLINEDNKV